MVLAFSGARTLLGAPGLITRNKKQLGAPGIATRIKKLLVAPGLSTSNKKLLGGSAFFRSKDVTRGSRPY